MVYAGVLIFVVWRVVGGWSKSTGNTLRQAVTELPAAQFTAQSLLQGTNSSAFNGKRRNVGILNATPGQSNVRAPNDTSTMRDRV
jgi:hypothetical protein